jgi:uncharacterized protein
LTGRVVDEAGILPQATRDELAQLLEKHEGATHQQVVVVTLPSLQGLPIEEFGYRLGRAWGIGERGKDTGALLIVAPKERQVRIEVGYGLEDRLTDAASRLIIEGVILPAFRRGDMAGGILAGTEAMLQALGGGAAPGMPRERRAQPASGDFGTAVFLVLLILFVLLRFRGRGGGFLVGPMIGGSLWSVGRRGGDGGGFSGGGGSFGGGGASGRW